MIILVASARAGNKRAGEEGRWARAPRTRLACSRRAPLSRGGGTHLESHVQESTWKVDFVHSTGLQLGRMYKYSHRSAFLYMTIQIMAVWHLSG